MTLHLYALFVAASALLIATPGPNAALIVGTSLRHGARSALATIAGVNAGRVLQLAVVAAGLSWIVELFAHHFDVIRYVGAGYLVLLGLEQLLARAAPAGAAGLRGERAFARGFAVAFSNPKTLVFHAAFLPQFLAGSENRADLWLLAATFALLAAIGDALYATFAVRARAAISERGRYLAGKVSGAILLGGAAVLLTVGRR
jgi:homoserine/homoserine lactone efflux protein